MNGTKVNVQTQRNQRRQLRSIRSIERQTRNNFFFFELGFIFIIVPLLIVAFVMGPTLYYFAITQEFHLWPFYIIGVMMVFFELIAAQYYIKRFYLDPHNMTMGELLRYKFDSLFKQTKSKGLEGENNLSWYENLDDFINAIRLDRKEKTDRLYATAYNHIDFDNE